MNPTIPVKRSGEWLPSHHDLLLASEAFNPNQLSKIIDRIRLERLPVGIAPSAPVHGNGKKGNLPKWPKIKNTISLDSPDYVWELETPSTDDTAEYDFETKNDIFKLTINDERKICYETTPLFVAWKLRQFHVAQYLLRKMKETGKDTRDTHMFDQFERCLDFDHYDVLEGLFDEDERSLLCHLDGHRWVGVHGFERCMISALHIFACVGDLEMYQMHPDLMAKLDAKGGCIPVQVAAACCHLDVLRWMVELKPRLLKKRNGESLLHFACGTCEGRETSFEGLEYERTKIVPAARVGPFRQIGSRLPKGLEVLKVLLEQSVRMPDGPNPWKPELEVSNGFGLLYLAVEKGSLRMVKFLVEAFEMDPLAVVDAHGCSMNSLTVAAKNGHVGIVKYVLEEVMDLETRMGWGFEVENSFTVLGAAAAFGREEVVDYLSNSGSVATFRRLLKAGAVLSAITKAACLDAVFKWGLDEVATGDGGFQVLAANALYFVAIKKANLRLITAFLEGPFGSAVKRCNLYEGTPILDAVSSGDLDVAAFVVKHVHATFEGKWFMHSISETPALKIYYLTHRLHDLVRSSLLIMRLVKSVEIPFPLSIVAKSGEELDTLIRTFEGVSLGGLADGIFAPLEFVKLAVVVLRIRLRFEETDDLGLFDKIDWPYAIHKDSPTLVKLLLDNAFEPNNESPREKASKRIGNSDLYDLALSLEQSSKHEIWTIFSLVDGML
ncbi:hypothetical protein HDU97_005815 [Phlyctochytrium planicorne]|nr:hypothetical protein HDU97_005815 [Phlyctochytrium planicorne]